MVRANQDEAGLPACRAVAQRCLDDRQGYALCRGGGGEVRHRGRIAAQADQREAVREPVKDAFAIGQGDRRQVVPGAGAMPVLAHRPGPALAAPDDGRARVIGQKAADLGIAAGGAGVPGGFEFGAVTRGVVGGGEGAVVLDHAGDEMVTRVGKDRVAFGAIAVQ